LGRNRLTIGLLEIGSVVRFPAGRGLAIWEPGGLVACRSVQISPAIPVQFTAAADTVIARLLRQAQMALPAASDAAGAAEHIAPKLSAAFTVHCCVTWRAGENPIRNRRLDGWHAPCLLFR